LASRWRPANHQTKIHQYNHSYTSHTKAIVHREANWWVWSSTIDFFCSKIRFLLNFLAIWSYSLTCVCSLKSLKGGEEVGLLLPGEDEVHPNINCHSSPSNHLSLPLPFSLVAYNPPFFGCGKVCLKPNLLHDVISYATPTYLPATSHVCSVSCKFSTPLFPRFVTPARSDV
jgi:hypothetical protein